MPKLHFITSDKEFEVPDHSSVLRMSLRYDGDLPNRCGGGTCGTCVCKIERGLENVDQVKPAEKKKLGEELLEQGYRLGCQTFINGDVSLSWDPKITKMVQKRKIVKMIATK
ncbi:2Fe-2S iron-sulfur cluster-binding protein [Fictibacillus terranigra]|uniref:2Fe-2S iron-sulfur cluster-binding protein n=1 Tax=Fictibacillus terranigra TaxID=3058424 RepID=A0ABT8EDP2_9BACL|nr:2Fe-2S iron-sulfur cluster-binding protein [Fictibacillus sp. CENA-BCM004]MDN4076052.1 2Fe-2S iron-sulfur cluster-binding protein [Fictibacillus sp. CENA-BCM004]